MEGDNLTMSSEFFRVHIAYIFKLSTLISITIIFAFKVSSLFKWESLNAFIVDIIYNSIPCGKNVLIFKLCAIMNFHVSNLYIGFFLSMISNHIHFIYRVARPVIEHFSKRMKKAPR
jgi:hypothetical protein